MQATGSGFEKMPAETKKCHKKPSQKTLCGLTSVLGYFFCVPREQPLSEAALGLAASGVSDNERNMLNNKHIYQATSEMSNYCGSLSSASPKPFLMGVSLCCPQAALRLHDG